MMSKNDVVTSTLIYLILDVTMSSFNVILLFKKYIWIFTSLSVVLQRIQRDILCVYTRAYDCNLHIL